MDDILPIFMTISVLLVCGVLYLSPWWIRMLWPKVRWCLSRKQTEQATLLALNAKYPLYLRDGGWFKAYDEEIFHTHYATFKTEDGQQYTMRISKAQYQEMMTGATGQLTHQGCCFISFKPDH
ncbi:MAG: DUF2500 family protein [Aristaeellaceae bacterium]